MRINNRTMHKVNERLIMIKQAQMNKKRVMNNWQEYIHYITSVFY
jgi:hypothetical protein